LLYDVSERQYSSVRGARGTARGALRGALREAYFPRSTNQLAERESLIERKQHVSPLNRVYPRPTWLARERLRRSERVAARNRIGYRWRFHRRELKRVNDSLPGHAVNCSHPMDFQPVMQTSSGVDPIRRERSDYQDESSEMLTEDLETVNDTEQHGQ
jgi:hypothetical protein